MFGSTRARVVVLLSGVLVIGAASFAPAQAVDPVVSGTTYVGSTATPVAVGTTVTATERSTLSQVARTVGSQGHWELPLSPGVWDVCFDEGAPGFGPSASFLDDDAYACLDYGIDPSVTTAGITKVLPRASSVSGNIGATSGLARLLTLQPDGSWGGYSDPSASIDPNGDYVISQVPDGDYRLCFEDLFAQPTGCAGGAWPESATAMPLAGSQLTGQSPSLTSRRTVTGTVTAFDGSTSGIAGAEVALLRSTAAGWQQTNVGSLATDGSWTLQAIPGAYRVLVTPPDGDVADAATTTDVSIPSGSGVFSTPATTLDAGGSLSGHLNLPTGESHVLVRASFGGVQVASTYTDASADFTLPHLRSGRSYAVTFAYDDFEDLAPAAATCQVSVPCNATLTYGAAFGGTVVDADDPRGGITVTATPTTGSLPSRSVVTDGAGHFSLTGLGSVPYRVSVDPSDSRALRFAKAAGATIDLTVSMAEASPLAGGQDLGILDLSGTEGHVAPAVVPTISGTPQVGNVLTASTGSYSPAPTQVLYTWYADSTQVTAPSVSPSYVVTAADVNRQLSVQVTAQATGYKSARVQPVSGVAFAPRPATPASPTTLTVTRGPSITGKAKVGKRLSVDPGAASPSASTSIQWLRNGAPIARATGTSYKLTRADKGKRISVRVVYARSGSPSVTRTSAATGTVAK